MKSFFFVLSTAMGLSWASQGFGAASATTSTSIPQQMSEVLTCSPQQARSRIFDVYYSAYESHSNRWKEGFKGDLDRVVSEEPLKFRGTEKELAHFKSSLISIHSLLTQQIQQVQQERVKALGALAENESDPVLHLIRLEMRSQIDRRYIRLNEKLDKALGESEKSAYAFGLNCAPTTAKSAGTEPEPSPTTDLPALDSDLEAPKPALGRFGKNHPLTGALWTMATAYQSCQVLDLPPVTFAVETVRGVVFERKIDAVGWGRKYTDLELLKKTHYYHRGQKYGAGCLNQDKRPLVYDYGGRPVINPDQTLNLFANAGGGSALGIDCSAYVSTAAAVAGNRYKPSAENKPVYTRFASYDFVDPVKSGWTCYDSISLGKSEGLRPGDIVAVPGHVLMIDEVGADPFGLNRIKSAQECSQLTMQDLDFTVVQSSFSKQHLGINRYIVKDYLREAIQEGSKKMHNVFLDYAQQACRSKFDGVVRKPVKSSYRIIRHRQTEQCLAPRLALQGEGCIASCK